MKKFSLLFVGFLLFTSFAWADGPDLEGRISNVEYSKSTVVIRNELKNKIGNRDYRVAVKQGMINSFKENDRLRVWLGEDGVKADMIELVSR